MRISQFLPVSGHGGKHNLTLNRIKRSLLPSLPASTWESNRIHAINEMVAFIAWAMSAIDPSIVKQRMGKIYRFVYGACIVDYVK